MLRFDDLMAARILSRQDPRLRDALLAGLQTLQEGGTQRNLLASLTSGEVITWEQAQYAFNQVQRYKRNRSVGIYYHLLTFEGVPAAHAKELVARIGPEGDIDALGEAVALAVPPDREQQLRFQARLVFDRDLAKQVDAFLETRGPQVSAPSPAEPDATISQVVRLPQYSQPPASASGIIQLGAEGEEGGAAELLRGSLSDADRSLPGPQFRIPDWVDTSDPRTGKQIEAYRFLGRIGAGAMGTVYLADRQDDPARPIALKILERGASPDDVGRFKREILAQSFFSHSRVIDVYDAGETKRGHHYLAMEFLDGEDLEEILENEEKLSPKRGLVIARQICEALGAAHEAGIVHRDVKPANILVSRNGEEAKLTDFGIAIIRDLGEFQKLVFDSGKGGVKGTPMYVSPEQAAGYAGEPASDLYSLGLVLYQTISGRFPFQSETSHGYVTCHMLEEPLPLIEADPAAKSLPRELHELLDRLLQKEPKDRPPSAAAVVEVIDRVLPRVKDKKAGKGFWGFLGLGS